MSADGHVKRRLPGTVRGAALLALVVLAWALVANGGAAASPDHHMASAHHVQQAGAHHGIACHDPDVVQTFLAWRSDPKLESILDLAAALDDDSRDQLLFSAEDLYSEAAMRVPKARA